MTIEAANSDLSTGLHTSSGCRKDRLVAPRSNTQPRTRGASVAWRRALLLLVAILASGWGARRLEADQIWFISARDYDCPTTDLSCISVQQFAAGCWYPDSFENLAAEHQNHPEMPTVIFVHGNRMDEYWSKRRGMELLQHGLPPEGCRPPVRLVIWAWRSDKIVGPRIDFEIKAARAVRVGSVLAATLDELGGTSPRLVGYSLGAQVIAQAFIGNELRSASPYRLAFIAPVLDKNFAATHCCDNIVSRQVEKTFVWINTRDPVARLAGRYNNRHTCGAACTFDQWIKRDVRPLGPTEVVNVAQQANPKHHIDSYLESSQMRAQFQELIWPTR